MTIVTLGIYPLYWHYKAYNELIEEFGVGEFPTGLYVASFIPIVNIVTQIMFMSSFIEDLNTIRSDQALPTDLSLGEFLAWAILGGIVLVGPFVAYYKLQTSINDVWDNVGEATDGPRTAAPEAEAAPAAAE